MNASKLKCKRLILRKEDYVEINPSLGKVGPSHRFLCVGVGRGLAVDLAKKYPFPEYSGFRTN